MKESFSELVSTLVAKPRDVLARDDHSITFLVFSASLARFVALKVYRRDFFVDELILRKFQERATALREEPVPGLAFPLESGISQARLFQVTDLLPGGSLQEQVATTGPLSPQAAIRLAKLLLPIARQGVERHELRFSWNAAHIQLWLGADGDWRAGLADCDLRPPRNPWGDTPESAAVQGIRSAVRFAQGKDTPAPAWFDRWLVRSAGLTTFDGLEASLAALPVEALAEDGLLLTSPPAAWMPAPEDLPDCYDYQATAGASGLPCVYEATDLFRGGPRRVHLLPPESLTGPVLEPYLRQASALAWQRPAAGFLPIDAVMRDPRCRLIAEKTTGGLCLADLLVRRGKLSAQESTTILRQLHDTIGRLLRDGWEVPPLECRDIYLFPTGRDRDRVFFGDLSDPASFEVKVRAFPSNLMGRQLPSPAELARPGLDLTRFFLPENAFLALAFELITNFHLEGSLPAAVAHSFQATLGSSWSLNRGMAREMFLGRLEKALSTPQQPARFAPPLADVVRLRWQPWPEEAGIRVAVGVAAALVVVAGCYAVLDRPVGSPEAAAIVSVEPGPAPIAPQASSAASLDLNRAKTILEARKTDALLADLGRLREGWATNDPTQGLFSAAVAFIENRPSAPAEETGDASLQAKPIPMARASQESFAQHRRLAATGNLEEILWVGDYLGASLSASDQTEAVSYYQRAVALGRAEAMFHLAECHFRGRGVPRDPAQAVGWLEKAHGAGNPRATDVLATCYAVGASVAQDQGRAAQLYREAIRRGNRDSLGNLGFLYLTGEGVSADESRAYDLFRRGAQEEELWSMVISALCLEHGVGTDKDPAEARVLFAKAARKGHPGAIRWCNVNGVSI
jgi:TPR repeat protein